MAANLIQMNYEVAYVCYRQIFAPPWRWLVRLKQCEVKRITVADAVFWRRQISPGRTNATLLICVGIFNYPGPEWHFNHRIVGLVIHSLDQS